MIENDFDRLSPYVGPLSAEAVAVGINASINNAKRLIADSRILIESSRYPTACSLAILAIEEMGKVPILRLLSVASAESLKKCWKMYRNHREKNGMWIFPQHVTRGARRLVEFSRVANSSEEHTCIINTVKQLGLYTDCYSRDYWSVPEDVIDGELANELVSIADMICPKKETTKREIELWIEEVGPALNSGKKCEQKSALVRWHRRMIEEGLVSDGVIMPFEDFLEGL